VATVDGQFGAGDVRRAWAGQVDHSRRDIDNRAAPIPRLPPVTSAFLSVSSDMVSIRFLFVFQEVQHCSE
jgi:hypothetical protein